MHTWRFSHKNPNGFSLYKAKFRPKKILFWLAQLWLIFGTPFWKEWQFLTHFIQALYNYKKCVSWTFYQNISWIHTNNASVFSSLSRMRIFIFRPHKLKCACEKVKCACDKAIKKRLAFEYEFSLKPQIRNCYDALLQIVRFSPVITSSYAIMVISLAFNQIEETKIM